MSQWLAIILNLFSQFKCLYQAKGSFLKSKTYVFLLGIRSLIGLVRRLGCLRFWTLVLGKKRRPLNSIYFFSRNRAISSSIVSVSNWIVWFQRTSRNWSYLAFSGFSQTCFNSVNVIAVLSEIETHYRCRTVFALFTLREIFGFVLWSSVRNWNGNDGACKGLGGTFLWKQETVKWLATTHNLSFFLKVVAIVGLAGYTDRKEIHDYK